MAKITIEELSESLKNYLDGLGLTETQVQELIDLWYINNIGNIINLLTNSKTIVEAINEIYNSQDNVKQELVAALVAKGLAATTDMSFDKLIDIINSSNLTQPTGTANVTDVLTGKTFINSTGQLLTGTLVNQGTKTITPGYEDQVLPAGYYNKVTINGDSNLIPSNIKEGVTIAGVKGTVPYQYLATESNVVFEGEKTITAVNWQVDKATSYIMLENVTGYTAGVNISYSGSIKVTKNYQSFTFIDEDGDKMYINIYADFDYYNPSIIVSNSSYTLSEVKLIIGTIRYYLYR